MRANHADVVPVEECLSEFSGFATFRGNLAGVSESSEGMRSIVIKRYDKPGRERTTPLRLPIPYLCSIRSDATFPKATSEETASDYE